MINPPLKRHPALQPFSRDHYTGLVQAQHLLRAADATAAERQQAAEAFMHAWSNELGEHLRDEERLLSELMSPAQWERLEREHSRLRELGAEACAIGAGGDPGVDWARQLGRLLNDHIRWEERELFPAIEKASSEDQLADLARRTAEFEARRSRAACS